MAASSSGSRRYDVFPSFSGEDVRKSFLSHLLKELDRKSINTFIDHGIERSRLIAPELLLAIRESRISIVVFSKKYASSTWCLNELVEIHKCFKDLDQMVIPVFHTVDPSEVRKQTGEFGKVFEETCKGKPEDQKQRWMEALTDVANMAGEDLRNWPDEAAMVEKIANDVSYKLITPSNCFGDFVGIEAHIEEMNSMLCWESEEARMVGILGPSGIGKSTIARALFSQLSSQFPHRAFVSYKRTCRDDYGMKLSWAEQFLSEILGQKDMKIEHLGVVEQRLKHKKVLIVLDDVDDLELLKTLVGQTGWFGSGSRIIVITQDRQLLKSHEIDLIYEVEFPSKYLALEMLCRSAFGKKYPPDGFMELATEVATLAGNLPLGLSVIGSALKGKDKEEWVKNLPRLRDDLDGKIEKTLRVSYDRLDRKIQDIFLHIAWLFNGYNVKDIKNVLRDSDKIGLTILADKSLIRITPEETVEMHNLLQKLGREIVRAAETAESIDNPGKRRFLVDYEDIRSVLTDHSGTETVVGINLKYYSSDINQPYVIDENSFEGMPNLQFLIVYDYNWWRDVSMGKPQGLTYLPRKLRLLNWNYCSLKCLPSNFNAEYLVELTMKYSKLEKLWEGNQSLGSLIKKMDMSNSKYLKELPDLSNAKNLEEVILRGCRSLVTLPSSIQYLINLRRLDMRECTELESFPTHLINLESLEYLNLTYCSRLTNFPEILVMYTPCSPHHYSIKVEDCFWNKNHPGHDYLDSLMRCMPGKLRPEYLSSLTVRGNMLEKLWKGIQSLGSLVEMDLSECENLTEIPDLSKATNLERLALNYCKSLVTFPSTIGNLQKLVELEMEECTGLEVLPIDVNLSSLSTLNLSGCSRLTSFPQISTSIEYLYLNDTAIEQVPCCIVNFSKLSKLTMCGCKRLKNISPNIFRMTSLEQVDFSECVELVTALSGDASVVATMSMEDHLSFITLSKREGFLFREPKEVDEYFYFYNCFKLDPGAQELILRSYLRPTVLPGGEVPMYFTHRASGYSLITISVPQSSLSQEFLRFEACVVLEPRDDIDDYTIDLHVSLSFMQVKYSGYIFSDKLPMYTTDHMVLSSFKFPPELLPSELEDHDVEVYFSCHYAEIQECGVRLLNVFPSPEDAARCSENQQSGSETRDLMTLGTSEESYNLPCGQIVADTELTAPKLPLEQGEASAQVSSTSKIPSSSFSCLGAKIKECGVRLLNVFPSPDDHAARCSENQQSGETRDLLMTLGTSEESYNLPCGQIVADTGLTAPNLELSLWHGGFSAQVSSTSMIPSSSVSSSNVHGDGASLCLEEEALCVVDPKISEQDQRRFVENEEGVQEKAARPKRIRRPNPKFQEGEVV